MPKVNNTPAKLRAFIFHGVELAYNDGTQGHGECPFCKKVKFYVSIENGKWSCKSCQTTGNILTFLRQLWSQSATTEHEYVSLAHNRGLLDPRTLEAWGVVKSCINGDWLVPGYTVDGKLHQLYRYTRLLDNGKWTNKLLPTPGVHEDGKAHGIFGYGLFEGKKKECHICEGPWDGMAAWEAIQADPRQAARVNVLAVPGCGVFPTSWSTIFTGKRVIFLYDNDHPKIHPTTGKEIPPPGLQGTKAATQVLLHAQDKPEEVLWLQWGEAGYDSDLPNGYDVRDYLSEHTDINDRNTAYCALLQRVVAPSTDWIEEVKEAAKPKIDPLPCTEWSEFQNAWRKALKWTDGLDLAVSVMLACAVSTRTVGSKLWLKVVSPPSTGKSTLCEGLSVARNFVIAKSTIRGFFSGFKTDFKGEQDNSLLPKLKDKTLVIKDADALLEAPNIKQILSELRDIYDGVARVSYRNTAEHEYTNLNITIILCGTSSIRSIDSSELGERFLDVNIMDRIDEELEDDILKRVASRAARNITFEANGTASSQYPEDQLRAMQLTGGYVEYLRINAKRLFEEVVLSPEAIDKCINYGRFVAYMRARPSKRQEEVTEREFAARLVEQMVKLAGCLAVVLNKTEADTEVMKRVRQVAIDTARGRTLDISKHLYSAGVDGIESQAVSAYTGHAVEKERSWLRFLKRIGAARQTTDGRWRLTARMQKLYKEVVLGEIVASSTTTPTPATKSTKPSKN